MSACAAALLAAALMVTAPRRRLVVAHRTRGTRSVGILVAGALGAAALAAGPSFAASAGFLAVTVVVRRRRSRRRRENRCEGKSLAGALEVLAGELRVGSHPVRAFAVAAEESAGVVGSSLASLAARARLGADVAAGLQATARRSSVPQYWTRVTVCWQLATDHGLPVAMLVQAASRDITHRRRFVDRVDAGLSGARATAAVLACLPVLGMLLGQLLGAQPLRFLLGGGGWVLAAGVALQCAGILWSDRITDRTAS